MLKNLSQKQLLVALFAATASLSAQAHNTVVDTANAVVPYVIDGRGIVARSGTDLCWRTGFWTPAAAAAVPSAGCACDKDLLPKDVCEPPAPKAAAPAPAPAAPVAPLTKPAGQKITLAADALFDFDKAVLRSEGTAKLDDVVSKLDKLNLEVIIAVGHTDRLGSDKYNQKLSERRAAAVKAYLVSKGVDANRVYTEGKGEKQPVTGDTCKGNKKTKKLVECLQPDRRVDIEVIGTQK